MRLKEKVMLDEKFKVCKLPMEEKKNTQSYLMKSGLYKDF